MHGPGSQLTTFKKFTGVENTNIQKVMFTFPGRGEVPALLRALDRVWRVGTRPETCSVTPRNRGSLLLLLTKSFLVTQPFVKTKIQNSQYIAYIAHPNPSPGTGTQVRMKMVL